MSRHGKGKEQGAKRHMRRKNLSNTFGTGYAFKTISRVET
jgi:hypothetical protein